LTQESINFLLKIVFGILFTLLVGVFYSTYKTVNSDRKLKTLTITKNYIELRGDIISDDIGNGFTLAKSRLLYKASIDTRYLDPNKKDLFASLFSIYSGIDKNKILKKIDTQKRKGYLVLTYAIPAHTAAQLEYLKRRLNYFEYPTGKFDKNNKIIKDKIRVFRPIDKNSSFYSGLSIEKSGGQRLYPYSDTCMPLVGYVRRYEDDDGITRAKGLKGIEKYYDKSLNSYKIGKLSGDRDAVGNVIFNKYSIIKKSKRGDDVKLNINLKLQREIELLSDKYKQKFKASEIIVSIMETSTGKIKVLASSNRFNPKHIRQDEISHLTVNAVEKNFEPGSIIKPIAMALVFDKDKAKENELLDAHNKSKRNAKGEYKRGKVKIGRRRIGDDHRFKKRYITPSDIITYSSNIGILTLAQRLSASEFLDGYHSFGLGQKTGIDVADERRGLLHTLKLYQAGESKNNPNVYKATDSYGQGILATFIQVLTAYNVFNNDGKLLKPKVAAHIAVEDGVQIISPKTANIIKKMLIRTVKHGTGKATDIQDVEIGGKTGTAQIVKKRKYINKYISSFFGFANFDNKKYTIGVSVFEPSYRYHYASQSAVPIFKNVVHILRGSAYRID
jgi:cell division protein FtsI (penicillin-binding protein 3)